MRIALRPATPDDTERLLAWRNDPVTRANSRRQHVLSWAELSHVPPGVTRETYIGECDSQPVGAVLLDYANHTCELSWTVAPDARNRGIGGALVEAALAITRTPELIAVIKTGNEASRRIAQRLGFTRDETRDDLETWRLTKS
jgi:RimJ/RimL family protein N-acetyltransferase